MKHGEKVVAEAEKYIGTSEVPDGSNMGIPAHTGFIDACQKFWNMGRGTNIGPQPYCAMGASKWYRDANVDDQGLFSPSTAIMCSNAVRNNIRELRVGELAPPGSVIVKCGIHTEIVVNDRGNNVLECIGANTSNGVYRTLRKKSDFKVFVPAQILQQIELPTKIVYWFEDPKKMAITYGGWMTPKGRDKKLATFLEKNPKYIGRTRKMKSIKGVAKYKFQVTPPRGSNGGVSGYFDSKIARDKAKKKYELSHNTKVRTRSKRIIIES